MNETKKGRAINTIEKYKKQIAVVWAGVFAALWVKIILVRTGNIPSRITLVDEVLMASMLIGVVLLLFYVPVSLFKFFKENKESAVRIKQSVKLVALVLVVASAAFITFVGRVLQGVFL